MRRGALVVLACSAVLLLITGCSSSGGDASSGTTVGRPTVGDCHTYDAAAAELPTDVSGPVPCDGPHVGQTTAVVDSLSDPGADGSWTQEELETAGVIACGWNGLARSLGLTAGGLASTRVTQAFFGPTPEQAKQGARWVRCDAYVSDDEAPVLVTGLLADLVKVTGAFAQCTDDPPAAERAAVHCRDGKDLWAAVSTTTVPDASNSTAETARAECAKGAGAAVAVDGGTRWKATAVQQPGVEDGTYLCWLPFADWNVDASTWPAEKPVTSADAG